MLLHSQLQEGLLYAFLESLSVSGPQNYKDYIWEPKERRDGLLKLRKTAVLSPKFS